MRRNRLVEALCEEVEVVPQRRLLTLLGQSIKYEQLRGNIPVGTTYNLFTGVAKQKIEEEAPPTRCDKTIAVCFFVCF